MDNSNNNQGQINNARENANITATQNKSNSPFNYAGQLNKINSNSGQINKVNASTIISGLENSKMNLDELREHLCILKKEFANIEMYVEAGKIKDAIEIIDALRKIS
jgi:hypothetical protein